MCLSAEWADECEQAFEGLKRKLVSAPVLVYANFTLPFILEVASYSGLGAVLSQEQVRPIAYASCGLKPTERNMTNYSSMKLGFLTLKWAMTEKFRLHTGPKQSAPVDITYLTQEACITAAA